MYIILSEVDSIYRPKPKYSDSYFFHKNVRIYVKFILKYFDLWIKKKTINLINTYYSDFTQNTINI